MLCSLCSVLDVWREEVDSIPYDAVVVVLCLIHVVLSTRLHSQYTAGLEDEGVVERGTECERDGEHCSSTRSSDAVGALRAPRKLREAKSGDTVVTPGQLSHLLLKGQSGDERAHSLSGRESGIEPREPSGRGSCPRRSDLGASGAEDTGEEGEKDEEWEEASHDSVAQRVRRRKGRMKEGGGG
jgi:hypothetical protein